MTLKFKTKPDAVHKMLGDYVGTLPEAAEAFRALVSAKPEARADLADVIHAMETASEERCAKLVQKVAGTFITPYDREDLFEMIEAIDVVVDWLDHAAYLVVDFAIVSFPEDLLASATELVGMSEQARDAVQYIKKQGKLEKALFAINEHENTLDTNYRALLVKTLVPGVDVIEYIKIKVLADLIEQVATQLDAFTRTIAVAAIKET
ncbi:MAG: DUF47 family protein [Actinomycetes bacterium]